MFGFFGALATCLLLFASSACAEVDLEDGFGVGSGVESESEASGVLHYAPQVAPDNTSGVPQDEGDFVVDLDTPSVFDEENFEEDKARATFAENEVEASYTAKEIEEELLNYLGPNYTSETQDQALEREVSRERATLMAIQAQTMSDFTAKFTKQPKRVRRDIKAKSTDFESRRVIGAGLGKKLRGLDGDGVFLPYYKRAILSLHNSARKEVVNAILSPFRWSYMAEAISLVESRTLVNGGQCDSELLHSKFDLVYGQSYGYNVFASVDKGQYYITNVSYFFDKWLKERENFISDDPHEWCLGGDDCLRYTQLVWGKTRYVGCAYSKCNKGKGVVIVCNYTPAGNNKQEHVYPTIGLGNDASSNTRSRF